MSYRSTITYLIAVLILVAFYLYDTRTQEKKEKAKEEAKQLFQINADHLDTITLKKGDATIVLKRRGVTDRQEWEIMAPIQAKTENFTVRRLIDTLIDLKYVRLISEKAEDMTQFGLDRPIFTLSYQTKEQVGSLTFGHRSPIEDGFYAVKREDKKVYIISTNDKETLDKTLFDLRDKRLFSLETGKVNRIVIDRGARKWVLFKKEGRWVFEGDEAFKIDKGKVESLLRRTLWEEAKSFEEEEAGDLKPFGLDKPNVRLFLSDGKKSEEMIVGNPLKDDKKGRIYAKMVGRPQVITVRKFFIEDLPKTKNDLKEEVTEKEEK